MSRVRYNVTGFIRVQVSTTIEAANIDEALNSASRHFDEAAKSSVKVLKEKASNLAGIMSEAGTVGVVESVSVHK